MFTVNAPSSSVIRALQAREREARGIVEEIHRQAPANSCVSCVNAAHGADLQFPSTCWPFEGIAPLGRAQEQMRLSLYTLPPSAGTLVDIFGRILTRTQRSSLNGGSACLSQSSAGR